MSWKSDKIKHDRSRKAKYKFHSKNFPYTGKKCKKCGKRKSSFHHYLCQSCYKIKEENQLKNRYHPPFIEKQKDK